MLVFKKAVKNTKIIVEIETKIRSVALRTLQIEADTLHSLATGIDEHFCTIVKTIYASGGRLIVTGIGKSAIVAQKIVATLNSTGTPAVFMHAADAIHGDLGMILPDDMVLCLSKSGDTSEIKVLLPLLQNLGNKVIGMTGRRDSYLGQQAQFILYTPVSQEADPNNLAPTASTTAQMAMGDALATALLALRGFTQQDFAKFHPGGALGKQLYLRVRNLYPLNEKPKILEDTSLHAIIVEMTSKRLGVAVVVNASEEVVGIITDGDLRRMLEKNKQIEKVAARDIMSRDPKTIQEDALAVEALQLMRANSITQLIVADGQRYLGIIHLHDLVREGLV